MKVKSKWALMKVDRIYNDRSLYLWRLRVVQTPWFAVYLHKIHKPDADRHLHDHPWSFVSLILKGGYREVFASSPAGHRRDTHSLGPGSVRFMRRGHAHRISGLINGPAWTLVLIGPRKRTWGFWVPSHEDPPHRWIDFETYLEVKS